MSASPGTFFNLHIKNKPQHKYLGATYDTESLPIEPLRYGSGWIIGTSSKDDIFIIWKKDRNGKTVGMVYRDVPEWKRKALRWFAKPETDSLRIEELSSEELQRLLRESIERSKSC